MNIHFTGGAQRHPATGKIVQAIAFEFEPEEWDRFAAEMAKAFDENENPIKEKVLRAMVDVLQAARVGTGSFVVPVEHVTPRMMNQILHGQRPPRKLPGED